MDIQEARPLQDLNLVDRFLFDETMEVPGMEPGSVNFNLLNDTCLILIAPFDLFGKGLYRYTFRGACEECPELKLRDGAVRVFINTRGTNRSEFSQEFLEFMEYLTDTSDQKAESASSERIKTMHREVQKIKASEKMGVKYMQKWEERVYDRLEGKIEGKLEGKKEAKDSLNKLIQALIRDNRLEDLIRSTTDLKFQEELLHEYHILV